MNDSIELHGNILVLEGDSRTVGWNCSSHYPYADLLTLDTLFSVFNVAAGGQSASDLRLSAACQVDQNYNELAEWNIIVVWIGIIDILSEKRSVNEIYDDIKDYCLCRRQKGWKMVICTEVSARGTNILRSYDKTRTRLNVLINKHWSEFADAMADLGGDPRIGPIGAYESNEFFCDGIHLTNQGYTLAAEIISQAINGLLSVN